MFKPGTIVAHVTARQEMVITEFIGDDQVRCQWFCGEGVCHDRVFQTEHLYDLLAYNKTMAKLNDAMAKYKRSHKEQDEKDMRVGIEYFKKTYPWSTIGDAAEGTLNMEKDEHENGSNDHPLADLFRMSRSRK